MSRRKTNQLSKQRLYISQHQLNCIYSFSFFVFAASLSRFFSSSFGFGFFSIHCLSHSALLFFGPHHSFLRGKRPYFFIISVFVNPPRCARLRARESLCS